MTSSPAYITDRQSLRNFVDRVRHHDRIALDTEFVGEDSFVPRLELIQVAAGDLSAAIDFPAVGSLDDFGALLADPAIEKVVHAGRQDLELFYAHTGHVPTPIFDTQVAAAMVGYGTQIAYAQLVQRIVGIKLTKAHTFTNWSQRPLTKEQVTYALDDVHYLLPVHTHLQERLKALGRTAWVEEEFIRLGSKLTDGSREPRHRYQRIRGWENLKPRCAAVLRELVAWREEEAKRRDVPRGRVIRDEVLLEMARHIPTKVTALRGMRGLHGSEIDRNGEVLIQVIEHGLRVPASEWPEAPKGKRSEPEAAGQVDLLQAVLKAIALKEEIAPALLAGTSDLQELVDAKHHRDTLDLPILHGWRRKLAGETLLEVLRGRVHVSIDAQTGALKLISQLPHTAIDI